MASLDGGKGTGETGSNSSGVGLCFAVGKHLTKLDKKNKQIKCVDQVERATIVCTLK